MVNNDRANTPWRNDFNQLEQASDRPQSGMTTEDAEQFRLSTFLQDNANPVLVFSPAGTVIKVNLAARQLLRQLELRPEALLPRDHNAIVQARLEGEQAQYTVEVYVKERILALTYSAMPAFGIVYLYALDLTEHRKAEDELLRVASNTIALAKRALNELQTFRQSAPAAIEWKFIPDSPETDAVDDLFVAMDGCIFSEKAVSYDTDRD